MTEKKIAFVLGGGGARGALQVGALRALLEADIHPQLIAGTSVGAINGASLANYGFDDDGIAMMEASWHDAAQASLLPSNYLWLTIRALFNKTGSHPVHRMEQFFIEHGITPDLKFEDLKHPLLIVSADLNATRPIIFGRNPAESVLESLLASTALPPWIHPLEKDGRFLIDGGVVSNLPIEPVLQQGATEIIALDLSDPAGMPQAAQGFGSFFDKLITTIEQRQLALELALARAHQVTVHHILLKGKEPVPIWDFQHTDELIKTGYQITKESIAGWQSEEQTKQNWFMQLAEKIKHWNE